MLHIGLLKGSFVNLWENAQMRMPSITIGAWGVFIVSLFMVLLLGIGAFMAGWIQGNSFVMGSYPLALETFWDAVNNYGLFALTAFCYFTNVKKSGLRREIVRDMLTIATGFFVSQFVFHLSLVRSAYTLIMDAHTAISCDLLASFSGEWVMIIAMGIICLALAVGFFITGKNEPAATPAKKVAK